MRIAGLVSVLWLLGCVEPSTLQCGDLTCPGAFVCVSENRCVSPEAFAECSSKDDGVACSSGGASGQCSGGACVSIVCGNGRLDPGEVCDDGNLLFGDQCNPTCNSDLMCGNGFLDPGEGCDCGDGQAGHENSRCATSNSDASTATCRTNCTPHACGDGVVEGAEQCEPGVTGTRTCADFAFYSGTLGCNDVCQYDISQCTQTCGDLLVNGTEECDGAAPASSCVTFGYDRGSIGCSNVCRPSFVGCATIGWIQNVQDSRGFYSAYALSSTAAWGAGFGGTVVRWNGTKWQDISIPDETGYVVDLWAASPTALYAIVEAKIYKHDGAAWSLAATAANTLTGISGNGSRIIAVGYLGLIYTTDGGAWQEVTPAPTALYFTDVHVVSATEAYAIASEDEEGVLLAWNGTSWSPMTGAPLGQRVWGRAPNDLYVGGSDVSHWDGVHWETAGTRVGGVASISGSATDVFVANYSSTILQFDGAVWHRVDTGLPEPGIGAVAAAPDGFAVATGKRMSRYVGSEWTGPSGTQLNLNGISADVNSTLLVVGDSGFAMHFTGTMWRRVPSDATTEFHGVSRKVAVGRGGTLSTFDGTRLTRRPTDTTAELRAVWASSDTNAWAVGESGTIVRFDGSVGTAITSPATESLWAVFGLASNRVYAVGDGGKMYWFNGTSWAEFPTQPPTTTSLRGIWAASESNIFVAGVDGAFRFDGNQWTDLAPPSQTALVAVMGVSATQVYFATNLNDTFLWSGTAWSDVSMQDPDAASGLAVLGNKLYGAGPAMSLVSRLTIGSNSWTEEAPRFGSFLQPHVVGMFAAAANDVWAIGSSFDAIYHHDGALWTRVSTFGIGAPLAITGTSSSNLWIMSKDTTLRWNSTLSNFTATSPGLSFPKDIASGAAGSAWATDGSTIRRFTSSWTASAAITGTVNALAASAADEAFAVGNNGNFLRWTGSAWMQVPVPTTLQTSTLRAVWARSATDVFVAGDGVIARWTGGTNWTVWPQMGETLYRVFGHAADDVFAAGAGGLIMHFDGMAWSPVRGRTNVDIASLAGVGETTYVAGSFGPWGLHRDVAW